MDISLTAMEGITEESFEDPDDFHWYKIYSDPVTFAKAFLNNDAGDPWEPRWYQSEMLRCTALRKVVRAGRRNGKSEAMAVKILYLLFVNKNFPILLVCPYQSQITRVFDIMRRMIGNSDEYAASVVRDVSNPHIIQMDNGSVIRGFSSGAKAGAQSNQIRGQDAKAVFLDEADYLGDSDLESVMAILASHPECQLWASSTPTGSRRNFFKWCTEKKLGFKEFHYVAAESPSWDEETEEFFKESYSTMGYLREFLAEFGEEMSGVFKNSDINSSLLDYEYKKCRPAGRGARYAVGVDWNKNTGTHIVVTECVKDTEGAIHYKVVDKVIIEKQEFAQHAAVRMVIETVHKWNAEWCYVDAGYGDTQIEMLHKFGKENPNTKMDRIVKGIQMGSNIIIRDPVTGEEIKKPAKAFMVGIAARQLESGRCVLPKIEDTNMIVNTDEDMSQVVGLVQQMRNFQVTKISPSGQPTFSQDYEHTLTAWMLSLMAFYMELGDVLRYQRLTTVGYAGRIGEKASSKYSEINKEEIIEEAKKLRKKHTPAPRAFDTSPWGKDIETRTRRDSNIKKIETRDRQRNPLRPRKPGGRSNF
jgi:replicative DNA helicase